MAIAVLGLLGLAGLGFGAALGIEGAVELAPPPELLHEEADSASGRLLSARAWAELRSATAPVLVRLEYQVRPDSGKRALPLTLLLMGSGRVSEPEARVDGSPVRVRLSEVREGYFVGELTLPTQEPARGPLQVSVGYEVTGAWEGDGRVVLPLLVPTWVPADPGPQTFVAEVAIPPGMSVVGSFPTSVMSRPQGDEGGNLRIGLQAVPSALFLRLSRAGVGFPSLERGLDLLVVLVLLAMGIAGWRHVRRLQ